MDLKAKSELPSRGEAPAVHVVYSSRPAIGHNDHNGNISLSHEPVTNGQHSNGFSEKHHSIDVNGVDVSKLHQPYLGVVYVLIGYSKKSNLRKWSISLVS